MGIINWLLTLFIPLIPKFIVRRVSKRYVAGESLADAIRTVRELNKEGAMCTLDVLGEEVYEKAKAQSFVEEYIRVFDAIQREGLNSNVSIKPTMLGLKISEEFCLENVAKIFETAKRYSNFVRIDMEDHSCTDPTIRIYNEMQKRFGNGGIVFQSYLQRTLADIDNLPKEGGNVRLCKGIYIEPRRIAWKLYETVRANFLYALEKLIQRGIYVGIATHDERLVCGAIALIDKYKLKKEQYEFQMLLGVDPELRRTIIASGHRLRVYVPYGQDWYPYSIRRLRENPEIAAHIIKAFFAAKP